MPKIKSAIKRVEIADRNRTRNRTWRSSIRTARSSVENALQTKKPADAVEALKEAYSIIDRAVAKGVLHKNTANRKKSRLAEQLNKVETTKTKSKK